MNTLSKSSQFPSLRNMMEDLWNPENWMGRPFSPAANLPAVNIKEIDNRYDVEVAAPGFQKQDFKVDVENGVLTISAENKKETESEKENYTRREFSYSSFSRSFTLPENVKEDNINARYENGVLHVMLERLPQPASQKKSISVE